MSHYYFPPGFQFNRAFFNKKLIDTKTRDSFEADIDCWLLNNVNHAFIDIRFLEWVLHNTLHKININFEHGQFYYYWLNQAAYELSNAIWVFEYNYSKSKGGNEKVWNRDADAKREEFNKWMKENWR